MMKYKNAVLAVVFVLVGCNAAKFRSFARSDTAAKLKTTTRKIAEAIPLKSINGIHFLRNQNLRGIDPFQNDKSRIRGNLVYTFTVIPPQSESKNVGITSYFVLRSFIGQSPVSTLRSAISIDKQSQGKFKYQVFFDPQFSPNGKQILVKFGDAWKSNGRYRLFIFDTQTNEFLLLSPRYLTYGKTSWSPDSKYIAYVEGGNWEGDTTEVSGGESFYIGPLKLYVYDCKAKREYLVTTNDAVKESFSWLAPHTLLFSATSEASTYPNIFKFSVENKKSILLIKAAYRPLPSPDGKRILFYGPVEPKTSIVLNEDWLDRPSATPLIISDISGSKRVELNTETEYPELNWHPDSQRFFLIREKSGRIHRGQVVEWSADTQKHKAIVELRAQDRKSVDYVRGRFGIEKLSPDGALILANAVQIVGEQAFFPYVNVENLVQAVDVSSGNAMTVFQFTGGVDWDWHFAPSAEIVTPSSK